MGEQVKVLSTDDGGDPRTAALVAERLVSQHVQAVVGTYGSGITEATQSIFNEAGMIQIANGSTAVNLTEKGLGFFFRTCPRDDEQARTAVQAIQKLGGKKLAILHDNSTYSKELALETRKRLPAEEGTQVVFFDALAPKQQDYSAVMSKLKAAEPDFVFFTGYYSEAGLLLKLKKEMGWNVLLLGGDANNNPELVRIAGKDASAGFYFLSAPLPKDLPSEQAKAFVEAFTKKYGNVPHSIYAVLAGDGFLLITHAIQQTNSVDSVRLSEYLHKELKDFPGLTGTISFDPKGDRVGEVYRVYKVSEDGSFILQP